MKNLLERRDLPKSKWIMKQYWRMGQTRALLSLAMGMFTLGKLYIDYVPGLSEFGVRGALLLGAGLFLFFMGLGWLYDEKGKMWSQQVLVARERDPFQYVPNYRTIALDYPFLYAIVKTFRNIFTKLDLPQDRLAAYEAYLADYFSRRTTRHSIFNAMPKAKSFLREYPFESISEGTKKATISSRLKKSFETHKLRLAWVQALTGMAQDALVVGALYITVFIPATQTDDTLRVLYGFVLISIPLYLVLAIAGWIYDKRLKVWQADMTVKIERNPFSYVPEPRFHILVYPFLFPVIFTLEGILKARGISNHKIERCIEYLREYANLSVTRDEDMKRARILRKELGAIFSTKKTEG